MQNDMTPAILYFSGIQAGIFEIASKDKSLVKN